MQSYELSESVWWAFLIQAILLSCVFPLAFLAYKWVRAPQRSKLIKQDLARLGYAEAEVIQDVLNREYNIRDYLWPVALTTLLVFVLYSLGHPFTIKLGVWNGVLEELVDIFNLDKFYARNLLAGRFLLWGYLGAWVYSFNLLLRRFMSYDLTPGVYVFIINRFVLSWIIGAIVGVGLGTLSRTVITDPNINIATVYTVVFFIGFFPESGLRWLGNTARRALGQSGDSSKEISLSNIEGLSIWHQGRLQQEGLENVQNLATASIPALVIATPFTVGQIIDWVDQAILLVYANGEMYEKLEVVGVRCASDFLTISDQETSLKELAEATGINIYRLHMLYISLRSATNINVTAQFRWRSSLDVGRRQIATTIRPFDTITVKALMPEVMNTSELAVVPMGGVPGLNVAAEDTYPVISSP